MVDSDPEHHAARALVIRGITGSAETIDVNTSMPRMRFNIERFSQTRSVERNAGRVTTETWRPMPSDLSHVGSLTSVSDVGDEG